MEQKLVIFDMDGLMIDSERLTREAYRIALVLRGYRLDSAFYQTLLGRPVGEIRQRFFERYGPDFPFDETVATVHNALENRFHGKGVPLKRGLVPLLDYLRTTDCLIAVATSSDRRRVADILQTANVTAYFDLIVCGDEVTHGKPDPEPFLRCCEKAGCKPSNAIVLEDSEPGILAAHRAGIACFAVPDLVYPRAEFAEKSFRVVDSLLDVLQVLKTGQPFSLTTEVDSL